MRSSWAVLAGRAGLLLHCLLLAGCSSAPTVDAPNPRYNGCLGVEAASWSLQSKLWDGIYAGYFGPGTAGHCGNTGCHGDKSRGGFLSGVTRDSMYAGLLAAKLVSLEDPPDSRLINPQRTPLSWISLRGAMPLDNRGPNEAARSDLIIWLSGTRCGLLSPDLQGGRDAHQAE